MTDYVVATIKDWNIEAFERHTPGLPGTWHLITGKEELTPETLARIQPRYIFFPHWSWIVPPEILDAWECVCFHMTDVPYGRGGSPLQNLIARGHKETKLTALRMEEDLDSGPVYLKKPLGLEGRAQDIFERVADIVYDMVGEIVKTEPEPAPQEGEPVIFERRTPAMSEMPKTGKPEEVYDHIRMLDAESYPQAFIRYGDFVITFRDADLAEGESVKASVEIRKAEE